MSTLKIFIASAIAALLAACAGERDEPTVRVVGERTRLPASPVARSGSNRPPSPARRHVILVVGDGMQLAHEIATSRYLFGVDDGLSFHRFPKRFYKATWDVNVYDTHAAALGKPPYSPDTADPTIGYDPARGGEAPYPIVPDSPERRDYFLSALGGPAPDSASTATAMSSGIKTYSRSIAWRPGAVENGAVETSPARLRRLYGMATGLVTTVPFAHATPGAFFAHNRGRDNYSEIAREILFETRPEVIIGGFGVGQYGRLEDLEAARTFNDWVFVERRAGVDGATSVLGAALRAIREKKGLLGVFGNGAGHFDSPVPSDTPGAPSITRGSVENPRLADAVLAGLEVLSQDPDGFFLLVEQGDIDWANHANDFARMIGCVWDLHVAVEAIVEFVNRPGDAIDWSNTTVMVTADHANSYMRLIHPLGPGDLPTQFGATYPDGDVTYGRGGHTNELVMLYAMGAKADLLDEFQTPYPGLPIVDDTAIYHVTLAAAER